MSIGTRAADITPAAPLCSVGTTAAIGIGLGAIGASTAAGIYGTHSANKTNERSQELQAANDSRAADLQAAQLAEQKAEYNAKLTADQGRWQDYLKANQPTWNASGGVLQSLYGLANLGKAPSFQMPSGSAPTSADIPNADGSGGVMGFPAGGPGPIAPAQPSTALLPVPTQHNVSLTDLMQLAASAKGGGPSGFGGPPSPAYAGMQA